MTGSGRSPCCNACSPGMEATTSCCVPWQRGRPLWPTARTPAPPRRRSRCSRHWPSGCGSAPQTLRLRRSDSTAPARSRPSRALGRTWDPVAEAAHRQVLAARPDRWQDHYNQGLFFKNRGRFAEGLAANQRALALGGDVEPVLWNLAICATGAGDGDAALAVWKQLGQTIERGPDGLPTGPYPNALVRLSEHPTAVQGQAEHPEDPGREETVWVRRLSPCHAEVICALYADLGVDMGDIVLHDGAAVGSRRTADATVPVFPHLATIRRGGWEMFWFAGTQAASRQAATLTAHLPGAAEVYVHTEQVRHLCRACAQGEVELHDTHEPESVHTVTGKICVPPSASARAVRDALDAALAAIGDPQLRLYSPDLQDAAGDPGRGDVEDRRISMILG